MSANFFEPNWMMAHNQIWSKGSQIVFEALSLPHHALSLVGLEPPIEIVRGLFNPGTFDPLIRSVRLVGFVELGEELDVGDKRVHL